MNEILQEFLKDFGGLMLDFAEQMKKEYTKDKLYDLRTIYVKIMEGKTIDPHVEINKINTLLDELK